MVATTERRPRGEPVLVDRWGEAAIAAAYGALVDVIRRVAADQGRDSRGLPLVPGNIYAEPNRLFVVPQARHLGEAAPA
jgi:hypothetical protein